MRVNLICDAGRRYNSTYGTSCPMYPSSSLDLSTPDQEEEEEEEEVDVEWVEGGVSVCCSID